MEWTPENIRYVRDAVMGWTQQQLADAIGASRRAVIGWEKGKAVPQGRFIAELDRVFGSASRGPLLRDASLQQCLDRIAEIGRDAGLLT